MSAFRFSRSPRRVYWELTRACDLACRHCRAEAISTRAPDELSTDECERVLDSLAAAGAPAPHVVFTGGDPLKRPDLLDLVRYAVGAGLDVSLAPTATKGLTRDAVRDLKAAGVSAMSLSLDGPTPAQHDGLRGVFGCFGWTLVAARRIVEAGIPMQINTLVSADTVSQLEPIGDLAARLGAARWSLFFLIATGRGRELQPVAPQQAEWALRSLEATASRWPFVLTTTEAPHFRRMTVQAMRAAGMPAAAIHASPAARAFGIRDGNGIMFIAANGDVTPSGFLPLAAGNVRRADPVEIYRHAPLFVMLREPDRFAGRCGVCEYRHICGGSRARAYATTGNVLGEDPLCAWSPDAEPETALLS